MTAYQLTGGQDPVNRIDRVIVAEPSDEYPEGKVLELNGRPLELTDEEYGKIAGVVRLTPVAKKNISTAMADYGGEPEEKKSAPAKSEKKED